MGTIPIWILPFFHPSRLVMLSKCVVSQLAFCKGQHVAISCPCPGFLMMLFHIVLLCLNYT